MSVTSWIDGWRERNPAPPTGAGAPTRKREGDDAGEADPNKLTPAKLANIRAHNAMGRLNFVAAPFATLLTFLHDAESFTLNAEVEVLRQFASADDGKGYLQFVVERGDSIVFGEMVDRLVEEMGLPPPPPTNCFQEDSYAMNMEEDDADAVELDEADQKVYDEFLVRRGEREEEDTRRAARLVEERERLEVARVAAIATYPQLLDTVVSQLGRVLDLVTTAAAMPTVASTDAVAVELRAVAGEISAALLREDHIPVVHSYDYRIGASAASPGHSFYYRRSPNRTSAARRHADLMAVLRRAVLFACAEAVARFQTASYASAIPAEMEFQAGRIRDLVTAAHDVLSVWDDVGTSSLVFDTEEERLETIEKRGPVESAAAFKRLYALAVEVGYSDPAGGAGECPNIEGRSEHSEATCKEIADAAQAMRGVGHVMNHAPPGMPILRRSRAVRADNPVDASGVPGNALGVLLRSVAHTCSAVVAALMQRALVGRRHNVKEGPRPEFPTPDNLATQAVPIALPFAPIPLPDPCEDDDETQEDEDTSEAVREALVAAAASIGVRSQHEAQLTDDYVIRELLQSRARLEEVVASSAWEENAIDVARRKVQDAIDEFGSELVEQEVERMAMMEEE